MAIDLRNAMAIGAFRAAVKRQRLIAVARYCRDSPDRTAEAAVTVHDNYQKIGIGTFLIDYLAWIGKQRGVEGFRAELQAFDPRMRRVLRRRFGRIKEYNLGDDGILVAVSLKDWKGHENPALEPVPV